MKITLFILLFVITNVPGDFTRTAGHDFPDGPRISFKETDHDFGTIMSGSDAIHYFIFSNTGEAPLVILNVRTACGCMVPSWPKSPIAAGMKDSLMVEYNTKIKGSFSKTITVQSNAENAVVELKIKGNVVKRNEF